MQASSPRIRPRAAIYARISRDINLKEEGVDRQIKDCEALAERLGYEVVERFRDNDISASTHSRKSRPEYNDMMDMARAGQIDFILAYSNSRLTRRVREYLDLIDLFNEHGVVVKTVVSGDHDLSKADGRAVALTIAAWDQAEAERTGERARRAKQEMRDRGEYRGGRRPYGYQKGGLKIKESEAQHIRKATHDVIAGRSLSAITREMIAAGAVTSTGAKWTMMSLRDVLTRPRNMGYLSTGNFKRHNLVVVTKGTWPAIVDEDTWNAMMQVLDDPSRKTTTGNITKWFGSGFFRCGAYVRETDEHGKMKKDENGNTIYALDKDGNKIVCGGPLRGTATGQTEARPNHKRKYHYRCTTQPHMLIAQPMTDDFVKAVIVEKLKDPEVVKGLSPSSPDMSAERQRRANLELRLAKFERDYAADLITGAQLQKVTREVEAEIEEIEDKLAKSVRRSTASSVFNDANPGKAFLAADVDIQRAVASSLVKVVILPREETGLPIGSAWSSERLRITPAEAS